MNCALCDTVNDDSANFCSQCGMPLPMRECHACGAVFDKSASACPKCGEIVRAAADSTRPAADLRVAPQSQAAAAPSTPAVPGEADALTARLVELLAQVETELAARRVAAAPSEEAPVLAASAAPVPVERTAARSESGRSAWWLVGGLVIAAAGALFYRFPDQFPDRFQQAVQAVSASFRSNGPAAAADPVAVLPALTPASAAVTTQSTPAPVPATQVELSEPAARAEPAAAGLSMIAPDALSSEAAPQTRVTSNAEPLAATPPLEQTVEPAETVQSVPARAEADLARTETTEAQPAGTQAAVIAPALAPKPAGDDGCRDGAVSALGLCGATTSGVR